MPKLKPRDLRALKQLRQRKALAPSRFGPSEMFRGYLRERLEYPEDGNVTFEASEIDREFMASIEQINLSGGVRVGYSENIEGDAYHRHVSMSRPRGRFSQRWANEIARALDFKQIPSLNPASGIYHAVEITDL